MDILGIGVPELVFIALIALIVLGPKDMQKAGKTIGTWMRKIVLSAEWRGIKNASRRLKTLPNELMREANLEDVGKELGLNDFDKYRNKNLKATLPKEDGYGYWGGNPEPANNIAPPAEERPASAKEADIEPKSETANSVPVDTDNQ